MSWDDQLIQSFREREWAWDPSDPTLVCAGYGDDIDICISVRAKAEHQSAAFECVTGLVIARPAKRHYHALQIASARLPFGAYLFWQDGTVVLKYDLPIPDALLGSSQGGTLVEYISSIAEQMGQALLMQYPALDLLLQNRLPEGDAALLLEPPQGIS